MGATCNNRRRDASQVQARRFPAIVAPKRARQLGVRLSNAGEHPWAEAYIIDAVRTPRSIGKIGKGALSTMHPQHIAATVLKARKDRNAGNRDRARLRGSD